MFEHIGGTVIGGRIEDADIFVGRNKDGKDKKLPFEEGQYRWVKFSSKVKRGG